MAINDIAPDPLAETASAVQAAGGICHLFVFDAAKKMPVQALVGEVVEACGKLDILINAAFVVPAVGMLEMDEWDWHRTLDMNLAGPTFAIQVAGRVMREQGGGTIVTLILDPEALSNLPGRSALAASQGALAALNRAAAVELLPYHIRVRAIPLKLAMLETPFPPGRLVYLPLSIAASPEEIAAQALRLCCSTATGANGESILL
jgi:NAD(P)-dependent dehydrogenase (short-subunit alcohol dehydrogenase family)